MLLSEERLRELASEEYGYDGCHCRNVRGAICGFCREMRLLRTVAAEAFEEAAHFAKSRMVKQYCKARAAELREVKGEGRSEI